MVSAVASKVKVGVCVSRFTVYHGGFDRLDAGHNFCQVSEGSIGTRHHLKDIWKDTADEMST